MVFYFIILFYWLLLFFFGKKNITNLRLFFAVLPLFLIMGLKSVSVGCDTISYYSRYVGAIEMMSADNAITEPGYNLLSYFFHDILKVPFWVYYAVMSLFMCFVLGSFIKHFSSDIYLSLFMYMTLGLFTMSMSGLRQTLAVYICTIPVIWAKTSDEKGNEPQQHKIVRLFLGILLVFLAFTIHNSAILFLPILFLFDLRLSKAQTIIVMALAVSTFLFRGLIVSIMGNFVFGRYEDLNLDAGYAKNVLTLLVPIVIGFFCSLVCNPEQGERYYSKSMSLMFVLFALFISFNILSLSQNQIGRIGYYFINSGIILIPYALKKLPKDTRMIVTFIFVVLSLIYFYLGTKEGTLMIDNYKFFWQEPMFFAN